MAGTLGRYWRWKEEGQRGELSSGMTVIVVQGGGRYAEASLVDKLGEAWTTDVPDLTVRDSTGMLVLADDPSPARPKSRIDRATTHRALGRLRDSGDIDPETPPGEGWRNVGIAVSDGRVFWAWERQHDAP